MWGRFGFDYGGVSFDYVIRGAWVLITVDDGGGGGKNCQNIDYVICERPPSLIKSMRARAQIQNSAPWLSLMFDSPHTFSEYIPSTMAKRCAGTPDTVHIDVHPLYKTVSFSQQVYHGP